MPGSDQMFGGKVPMNSEDAFARMSGPMLPNMAGLTKDGKLAEPMFPNIVAHDGPDSEEFDKEMDRIRYDRIIKLKDIQVLTFDFGKDEDVQKYRTLYAKLYPKIATGAIVFHKRERMQIKDAKNPRWILHMEYAEYELIKTDITEPPQGETGQPEKETQDESGEGPIP